MAVLKHPNLDFDNGTAPNSVAELVAIADVEVFLVHIDQETLPHPSGATLAQEPTVGYATAG